MHKVLIRIECSDAYTWRVSRLASLKQRLLDVSEINLSRNGPVIEPKVGDDYVLLVEEEALNDVGINEAVRRVSKPLQKEVGTWGLVEVQTHQAKGDPLFTLQFQECVDRDVVQLEASEYAAPLVVTWQKDGRVRLCVEQGRWERTWHFAFDWGRSWCCSHFYGSLSLWRMVFFHIDFAEESKKYLPIITPCWQYISQKAPFGFCNSLPVFQRQIRQIFQPLIDRGIVVIYMDDLLIKATNWQEALERLKLVLELASKLGLNTVTC